MDEQASDIVAILTETNTRTRRERAAFVARLREQGLSFSEIGRQVNVSPQRAQQLYSLHKFFQRSANSPFANLSTRARNCLNNVASWKRLPEDWEQHPEQIARLAHALSHMTQSEAFKFRQLGKGTFKEIEDFLKERGLSFEKGFGEALEEGDDDQDFKMLWSGPLESRFKPGQIMVVRQRDHSIIAVISEVYKVEQPHDKSQPPYVLYTLIEPLGMHYNHIKEEELSPATKKQESAFYRYAGDEARRAANLRQEALEDEGELETKHLTGGAPPDQAVQMLTQFMNENEWRGEFKIWPKGTYRGPFPEYAKDAEFSMTTSEFLADAFEENWAFVNLFDVFVKGLGYHVEHGSRSSLHFYFDPYIDQAPATPDQPEQMPASPPADLSNVTFD